MEADANGAGPAERYLTLRSVEWRDITPWIVVGRVPRAACAAPVMLLALAGTWLSLGSWSILGDWMDRAGGNPTPHLMRAQNSTLVPLRFSAPAADESLGHFVGSLWFGELNPLVFSVRRIGGPFFHCVRDRDQLNWRELLFCLLGGISNIVVWGLFGTAICRSAAAEIGAEQRVGLADSLAYCWRRLRECYLAPTLPLMGIVIATLPLVVLGWLMRFDVGLFLAGLVWILCLLIGLALAMVTAGLLLGWPLLLAAVAVEGKDAFDAVSRAYSYTFHRLLRYVFYVVVAALLGGLAWWIVVAFAKLVLVMTSWGVGWGLGHQRLATVGVAATQHAVDDGSLLFRGGVTLIHAANRIIASLATAFAYGYFWSAVSAIYLLLRRDTDQVELDEIHWDEPRVATHGIPGAWPDRPTTGPPSKTDSTSVAATDASSTEAVAGAGPSEERP